MDSSHDCPAAMAILKGERKGHNGEEWVFKGSGMEQEGIATIKHQWLY